MIELTETKVEAPRVVIYGLPWAGKTFWATRADNSILIDIEGGAGNLKVASVRGVETHKDLKDAIQLAISKGYSTVIVDSVERVEWIFEKMIMKSKGLNSEMDGISSLDYGKGYDSLSTLWRNFLHGVFDPLQRAGIVCILISHAVKETIKLPGKPEFDRVGFGLKRPNDRMALEAWADCIVYAQYSSGNHKYFVIPQDLNAFIAKCRYSGVENADAQNPNTLLQKIGWKTPQKEVKA